MNNQLKKSLCKFCNTITKTIVKEGLSASENKHYRYECKNCGFKKNIFEDLLKLRRRK